MSKMTIECPDWLPELEPKDLGNLPCCFGQSLRKILNGRYKEFRAVFGVLFIKNCRCKLCGRYRNDTDSVHAWNQTLWELGYTEDGGCCYVE